MFKLQTIYPRDIIAILSLIASFILIGLGINHIVSGIAIMIITYYFSKRVYEEKNTTKYSREGFPEVKNPRTIITEIPKTPIEKPVIKEELKPKPLPRIADSSHVSEQSQL